MWNYEKRLEYPIKIKQTNPTLAAMIISQYGGPYFNKVYSFSVTIMFIIVNGSKQYVKKSGILCLICRFRPCSFVYF